MTPTFKYLVESDRVDHDAKTIYTSPRPGAPPVPTTYWREEDWARWHRMTDRVRHLQVEGHLAGYRVVAI